MDPPHTEHLCPLSSVWLSDRPACFNCRWKLQIGSWNDVYEALVLFEEMNTWQHNKGGNSEGPCVVESASVKLHIQQSTHCSYTVTEVSGHISNPQKLIRSKMHKWGDVYISYMEEGYTGNGTSRSWTLYLECLEPEAEKDVSHISECILRICLCECKSSNEVFIWQGQSRVLSVIGCRSGSVELAHAPMELFCPLLG